MNNFKNEILIEGYIIEKDFENKSFLLKNNNEVYEFIYSDEFNTDELLEISEEQVVRVKGSFDMKNDSLFLKAEGILVRNGDE